MRQITKACFTNTSDDLLLPNVNNSNANAAATPELTMPKVATPELTSHGARIDDEGMRGDHVASTGESLSAANISGDADATEATETKDSTVSADLSSVGYIITVCIIE